MVRPYPSLEELWKRILITDQIDFVGGQILERTQPLLGPFSREQLLNSVLFILIGNYRPTFKQSYICLGRTSYANVILDTKTKIGA